MAHAFALEMVGEPEHVTDVFLFGGGPVIFELDELLELGDRRVVDFHPGRLPMKRTKDKTRRNETTAPTLLPHSGSVQQSDAHEPPPCVAVL